MLLFISKRSMLYYSLSYIYIYIAALMVLLWCFLYCREHLSIWEHPLTSLCCFRLRTLSNFKNRYNDWNHIYIYIYMCHSLISSLPPLCYTAASYISSNVRCNPRQLFLPFFYHNIHFFSFSASFSAATFPPSLTPRHVIGTWRYTHAPPDLSCLFTAIRVMGSPVKRER